MNKILKNILLAGCCSVLSLSVTGCLDEAFPQDGSFTEDQVKDADLATIAGSMTSYFTSGGSDPHEIGYPAFMIWRDCMTADYPVNDPTWDYFNWYNLQISIGNTYTSQMWWNHAYYHISYANQTLGLADEDVESDDAYYRGYAHALRSYRYFEMARMFEYKHTDIEALDRVADQRGIWGLTVPIITEKTTEADARRTPRAPFYEMYRFINSDLLNAQKYLASFHTVASKDVPSLGVAYGLAARFWLELGSRFEIYPDDLAKQIEKESDPALEQYPALGITSANDCYRKAADYARKAINEGYTPTTKSQWFDKASGFNTPIDSWMWAIIITPENWLAKLCTWKGWVPYHAPEAVYGMCESSDYAMYRKLDARLWSYMDKNDWRRDTWIDPEFSEMADGDEKQAMFKERYANNTSYDYDEFCKFNALAGFKYRPGSGDGTTPSVGNAVSIPLMRVEEMYLIEAEALAHCEGPAAGKAAIETFMNSFRMEAGTTFTTKAASLEDVVDEIWTQKRIELWGEGLTWFDYKRRELPVTPGYPGTNHPANYLYNSNPEAVAPWGNLYIIDRTRDLNPTVILNPDPTNAIKTLWIEQ